MELRRLAPVATALSAALALSACGAASPTSAPIVSPSIKTTAFTPLTKATFGPTVRAAVSSVRNVHVRLSSSLMNISGDFGYGPPLQMAMSGTIIGQGRRIAIEERLVGTFVYARVPGLTPANRYFGLDLSTFPTTAKFFAAIKQIQQLGPKSFASQFRAVSSVRYVGTADVDGQTTRHYIVTVSTASAFKILGIPMPASLPATITEQTYLNDRKIPVRIVSALPGRLGVTQIDFSNWGEPVHVTAPPASQVTYLPASAFGASA